MTLNQILYFQTVARHQHFRLAAAELSISQPSLSRSIAVLEEELGIILFERKGRTVTLTKYGKLFLEHADRILDEVRLAQKHMKKLSGNAGHVDIGYVFPLAAHYIPHTVRRFLSTQKNKDVTFNFHQSHTGEMIRGLKNEKYDVIVINFANPDMVGHTGIIPAAIKAIETVDTCVGKAVEALKEVDGQMFICADHGNAEQMVDYETGAPFTAHTTNPVPFILVNADPSYTLRENGCLADIIPTLIELMGMEQPAEMTGKSLLIRK